jgi:GNAT superfamily N-acetyltransferase
MIEVRIRPMTRSDIPGGNRLREIAGWNQTEVDWGRFLDLEPSGCFVACHGDEVVGTVTTLAYEGRVGWVGMVLTDPAVRRQGIGTRLLDRGIEQLERSGVQSVKLDATPMGRPVYVKRGFVDEYEIERWEGTAPEGAKRVLGDMSKPELIQVCRSDRTVFGADRTRLLSSIWSANPAYSAVLHDGSEISGYILGRAGSRAHYLGPWVATSRAAAEKLLDEFLARVPGEKVYVDVCVRNPDARALVEARGFRFQRPLTRMYRGPNDHPGQPERVCGIAGPELG